MWWNTFYNKFHRNDTIIMVKYIILFWTPNIHLWERLPFGYGQEKLFEHNCDFKNCFFTDNRRFFGKSLNGFDAIIFSGMNNYQEKHYITNLPKDRYQHQKYVYLNSEPAVFYPLCSKSLDNYFNWTYTYKLDSDCVLRYIRIVNKEGNIIYPQKNMHWINATSEVSKEFKKGLKSKTKAAAWFVSRCETYSNRQHIYFQLRKELLRYNLKIDVYGKCGQLNCSSVSNYRSCYKMLQTDYYFYLAFENSLSEDYVTEKVLHAVLNKVVPVVYGGANYSRFLPPGSYLNIQTQSIQQIALAMKKAIGNPDVYASYFKWTNHYRYLNNGNGAADSDVDFNICGFCKLMNDKDKFEKYSSKANIRSWWLPTFEHRCKQ